jgi:hypothetical protein
MIASCRPEKTKAKSTEIVSAKGAAFTSSLGQRPRIDGIAKIASAESAIHSRMKNIHAIEARFQRLFIRQSDSWGVAPGSPRRIRPVADWN